MKRTYSVIPPHRSLVPVSAVRQAALAAIAEVEDRQSRGRSLSSQPWARAFFRHLAGSGRATRWSLQLAGVYRDHKERGPCISEYERAFNILLQSNGLHCPLPLPDSVRHTLFPEFSFAVRDRVLRRKYTRWCAAHRQIFLQQVMNDQAGIEPESCSPATQVVCYDQQEDVQQDLSPAKGMLGRIQKILA